MYFDHIEYYRPAVEPLNYHHLRYFWAVARTGSVTAAARELHLAPSTVSAQVRALERRLGLRLLERAGGRMVPTPAGRLALRHAEEIFSLGRELLEALAREEPGARLTLAVGAVDVLPKLIIRRCLEPALAREGPMHLVLREARPHALLAELAMHRLDLVLAETPFRDIQGQPLRSVLLGRQRVHLYGAPELARRFRRGFPRSLQHAPLLLPGAGSSLRASVDAWLADRGLRPEILGEFEDSALLKAYGQQGLGLFPAPAGVEDELGSAYGVERVGVFRGLRESYYAVLLPRREVHPGVAAILATAAAGRLLPPFPTASAPGGAHSQPEIF